MTGDELLQDFLRQAQLVGQSALTRQYGMSIQYVSDIVNVRRFMTDKLAAKLGYVKYYAKATPAARQDVEEDSL